MKYATEFRNPALAQSVLDRIRRTSRKPARLMEFCGGHTVAIFRHGLRQLLPPNIEMLSGPGCPVCVTATADIDRAIAMAALPGVVLASFGDMVRVPGSRGSLARAKAEGADVRIVYSALDALEIARSNPQKSVIFLGIGFETTAPTVAATILQAEAEAVRNFYVLSLHKTCPPVMKAIVERGEIALDGIICPGHVSAIIGAHPYRFLADEYGIACAISGFEPLDILLAVDDIIRQIEDGKPAVSITYRRGVRAEGNRTALELMGRVFRSGDASWRGLGVVPESGLYLREEYARYDAGGRFAVEVKPAPEPEGCICGEILRGVATPPDCKLFRRLCTPERPIGPCMVSSEGSCATYYHYGAEGPSRERGVRSERGKR
ncbi:MAG: hydrogenase formation protein HypD [Dehalococcoidales bacterium]|nr:hydrogenase formation protein HypD [Dehalococcoidales bacterium]